MNAVTPKRKAPPRHVQGPMTLSLSQHLARRKGETPSVQGVAWAASEKQDGIYTTERLVEKTGTLDARAQPAQFPQVFSCAWIAP